MPRPARIAIAAVLDIAVIITFVAIGREEHDEGSAINDIVATAMPFLFGLLAGWLAAKLWRDPMAIATGLLVWPAVLIVGMCTRRWVFDDGTAPAFVVVATLFLGAGLVGWRAIARSVAARTTA